MASVGNQSRCPHVEGGVARRVVGIVAVVLVLGLAAAGPATADCGGPTIEYDAGPVARGDTVRVTGTGWGDNCYDTGPPPEGEGVLGRPQDGILIVLSQGDAEVIVAEGAADADYAFEVDVPVPMAFIPGEAQLSALRQDGGMVFDPTAQPITVTDAPAVEGGEARVTFGPAGVAPQEAPPADGDDGGGGVPWLGVGFVALVTVLGALVLGGALVRSPTSTRRRRDQPDPRR